MSFLSDLLFGKQKLRDPLEHTKPASRPAPRATAPVSEEVFPTEQSGDWWRIFGSSNVKAIRWLEPDLLEVQYLANHGWPESQYRYYGVPHSVFGTLVTAASKGTMLHKIVKKTYLYERLDRVDPIYPDASKTTPWVSAPSVGDGKMKRLRWIAPSMVEVEFQGRIRGRLRLPYRFYGVPRAVFDELLRTGNSKLLTDTYQRRYIKQ